MQIKTTETVESEQFIFRFEVQDAQHIKLPYRKFHFIPTTGEVRYWRDKNQGQWSPWFVTRMHVFGYRILKNGSRGMAVMEDFGMIRTVFGQEINEELSKLLP